MGYKTRFTKLVNSLNPCSNEMKIESKESSQQSIW